MSIREKERKKKERQQEKEKTKKGRKDEKEREKWLRAMYNNG